MNLFEIVKYGVGCREAAERYGVEVNHKSKSTCVMAFSFVCTAYRVCTGD